ncbi:methyl-accepting chemotaxis protein [Cupriavidus taiwanensis]|uniref:Methyl-accepting chemotaxis sensory transducer, Histidine kinase n=1 Tax=Cupriavidus taiwanensis TaxID=164546 RepID=A0A7Z7JD39_9BURK|nr:methyl-accepting chemotaxis protein [Cupriavidus taiwanensis]SOZ08502.1 Methyl-accepting chemotaxis sensory transducer, Histidine kinase [Cupriavidus taiwanensis]SOZ10840.1 Methyl-accepting chemotaxis sensory transducer, Histidine kinase [Cupriavidus taiwanensis]SOZ42059.1 Methyl-accepting chemotaxis sensory transducer, Histidine kinase [Cupriavidus taiwanensis]SPC21201.1 Methyl-accepting chemotaxis sensory transducer, Histidine kinase [Cupriavidus taiwanensis]SPD55343.1 Methyl-accepting ch
MNQWTIRTRILASFSLILLVMALMGVVAYTRLVAIERETALMLHDALPGLNYSTGIRGVWGERYVLAWQTINAADQAERQRFQQDARDAAGRLDKLEQQYESSITRADDRAAFQAYRDIRARYEQAAQVLKGQADWNGAAAATALRGEAHDRWLDARKAAQRLVDDNSAVSARAAQGIDDAVNAAKIGIEASLIVAVVVAVVCGYLLLRAITVPMQSIVGLLAGIRGGDLRLRMALRRKDEFLEVEEGFNQMTGELTSLVGQAQRTAIQVTTSVNEIAATARQQQATATETAATTTQIGATSREISATARDLVRTIHEVSSAAEQAAGLAGTGQVGLSRMEGTMQHVMEAAGSVNAKLATLNEKAGNINQVVTTIAKVADQTNLLSLNAAIEAEKAGEYGRGFAVVATEIRRLADQTAVATYDIEQMVREIQSAVSAGVMGMDKFSEEVRRGMSEVTQVGDQLSQIIAQVQSLAPRVLMVNEGMQAQAGGAEQINQALMQLSEAAQQTVESLRQSSQAIDELTLVANDLRSGVSRFKV